MNEDNKGLEAAIATLTNEQKEIRTQLDTIIDILTKYARRDGLISNKVNKF